MHRWIKSVALLAGVGFALAFVITRPQSSDPATLAGLVGDPVHGEMVFWAGGCASCHAAPGAEGDARLVLAGGLRLPTDFGTFIVPNISPDTVHGIGTWTVENLDTAMRHGTSAFPSTSA